MSASQGLAVFRICELLHLGVAKKTHPLPPNKERPKSLLTPIQCWLILANQDGKSLQVPSFVFRSYVELREPWGEYLGLGAMYYGFYLFAIALVVMVGQLAFALYQVASLFLSWTRTAQTAIGTVWWWCSLRGSWSAGSWLFEVLIDKFRIERRGRWFGTEPQSFGKLG